MFHADVVEDSTTKHCTVVHSTTKHYTVVDCTTKHRTVLDSTTVHAWFFVSWDMSHFLGWYMSNHSCWHGCGFHYPTQHCTVAIVDSTTKHCMVVDSTTGQRHVHAGSYVYGCDMSGSFYLVVDSTTGQRHVSLCAWLSVGHNHTVKDMYMLSHMFLVETRLVLFTWLWIPLPSSARLWIPIPSTAQLLTSLLNRETFLCLHVHAVSYMFGWDISGSL